MAGAIEAIIGAEVGGRFTLRERTVSVTSTVSEILKANPERAGWLIVNTGGTEVQFGWSQKLTAADSIPFGSNGGGASVNVREDFVLPIFPTYAVVSSGSSTLRVIEIVRVSGTLERPL